MSTNWHLTKLIGRVNLHVKGVLPRLINACEVDGAEIKMRKNGGNNDKILDEIREIKSDLESLKKQGKNANANRQVSSGDRKFPRETRYRGRARVSSV